VMVVCHQDAYVEEDMVNDATIIGEVLSTSTESYDRGMKFHHYQTLPSFTTYLLISQYEILVELYTLQENGIWNYQVFKNKEDPLTLSVIDFSLKLEELYYEILFPKSL